MGYKKLVFIVGVSGLSGFKIDKHSIKELHYTS